jgi:uncharacterized membrane protein
MTDVALTKAAPVPNPAAPASCVGTQALTLELRPHRSLTDVGARLFLVSVAVVSLGASTLIALRGGWPVLAFSALVILGTYAALRANMKARNDLQQIQITQHEVRLEYRERSRVSSVTLPRYWTRVRLHPSRSMGGDSSLFVESAGKDYEIGSFLTEPERRTLEAQLRALIGAIGVLPSLAELPP